MLAMCTPRNDKTAHRETAETVLAEQGSSRKTLGVAPQ